MVMYWKKVAMILALCEILGGCGQQLPISDADPSAPVSGETTPGAEGETTPPVEVEPGSDADAGSPGDGDSGGSRNPDPPHLCVGKRGHGGAAVAGGPGTHHRRGGGLYDHHSKRQCYAAVQGRRQRLAGTTAAPGTYQTSLLMVDSGEEGSFMAYIPQGWEEKENDCRRNLGIGAVVLTTAEQGGYTLTLTAPALNTGNTAECMLAQSPEALVDWDQKGVPSLWATYTNLGDGRWCYDGYYWITYSNYIPTGPDVYFQMSAAYLCRSMLAMAPYNRLADDLAPCMMDVMAQRQNEYGYFATSAGSEWLLGDYGIGAGFYDTRFNTI